MTSASLEAIYLGAAAAGFAGVLIVGWRGWISPAAIGFIAAGLGLLAVIIVATTYKDDGCSDDTACRLLAEPCFLFLIGVLPGMLLGVFVLSATTARRRARSEK